MPSKNVKPLVLIVEDDSQMADTLASMVRLMGYDTSINHSSHEALESSRNNSPDIVLLDLNLPDADGFQVCEQLRKQPELNDTPIIIVSADEQPESMARAKKAGADHYLVKPIGMDDLEVAIVEALNL